ncbi:hypothetical protein V2J09_004308 [Rumex salicifolius]
MTLLFRSKSYGPARTLNLNPDSSPIFSVSEPEEEEEEEEYDDEGIDFEGYDYNSTSTSFASSGIKKREGGAGSGGGRWRRRQLVEQNQFPIMEIVLAALRKSLVTCSVERDDVAASMEIGWPTEVRHVSHVTFDRFNGFLGLPLELQPEVPRRAPSASVRVFGVTPQSMQCSMDERGNSVPTILLMMQKRLYEEDGLQAEGVFRITADNSQEEHVRNQLNNGCIPHGIDIHCLAGLIKAWFRELPKGVLDCLTPEDVMNCNTQDECAQLVKLLPPTEASLLDWAVNLMADVAHNERFNKMNARNIAMVFAPNMTQMTDPLTALIHAVQVMNLLRTLIEKTLQEQEEPTTFTKGKTFTLYALNTVDGFEMPKGDCESEENKSSKLLKAVISDRMDLNSKPRQRRSAGKDDEGEGFLDRLSFRKGVKKLYRHPVFHLSKPAKKSGDLVL